MECFLLFLIPRKWNSLPSKEGQWMHDSGIIIDEIAVKIGDT
jgi:hypothetical protein